MCQWPLWGLWVASGRVHCRMSVTLIKTCMADGLGDGVRRTCRLRGGLVGHWGALKVRARALNALIWNMASDLYGRWRETRDTTLGSPSARLLTWQWSTWQLLTWQLSTWQLSFDNIDLPCWSMLLKTLSLFCHANGERYLQMLVIYFHKHKMYMKKQNGWIILMSVSFDKSM